jgi:hypothetical protein
MTTAQDSTAHNTPYTISDAGVVFLAGRAYSVEVQTFHNGHTMTWLRGQRGAMYFLRPYRGKDDGLRQVISWRSGMPLQIRGSEVRVVQLGDVIEWTR